MRRFGAAMLLVVACRPAHPVSVNVPEPDSEPEPEPEPDSDSESDSDSDSAPAPARQPAPDPAPRFAAGDLAPAGLDAPGIREYARNQDDPLGGEFGLDQAFAGDAALADRKSSLFAILRTNMGEIECQLFESSAPTTVANFVGLARGTRPFRHTESRSWMTGRFYDGTIFHRVIDTFMIQGGDRSGTGRGEIGYVIADEIAAGLTFEHAGMLAMANRGSNTASSQFFVTLAAAPHLNGKHTIFGRCDPRVPQAIGRVPVEVDKPKKNVVLERIEFVRR
jgi:peptidyl-prolyl cis-trans isomerase A (cyclophilin A)